MRSCSVLLLLLVAGTQEVSSAKLRSWRKDSDINSWNWGLPTGRSGHAMVTMEDTVVMFGGKFTETEDGLTKTVYSDEMFKLDIRTKQWTAIPTRQDCGSAVCWPSARSGHAMVSVGSNILLFGGETNTGEESNELWVFSTTTMTFTKVVDSKTGAVGPTAQSGHAMVAVGSYAFLADGWRFAVDTHEWTKLDLPDDDSEQWQVVSRLFLTISLNSPGVQANTLCS
jgi:N-acetylneuraminic acid mutarotase